MGSQINGHTGVAVRVTADQDAFKVPCALVGGSGLSPVWVSNDRTGGTAAGSYDWRICAFVQQPSALNAGARPWMARPSGFTGLKRCSKLVTIRSPTSSTVMPSGDSDGSHRLTVAAVERKDPKARPGQVDQAPFRVVLSASCIHDIHGSCSSPTDTHRPTIRKPAVSGRGISPDQGMRPLGGAPVPSQSFVHSAQHPQPEQQQRGQG